ncbi:MAG: L-serine ammonia-lyase, iron-sulfur-dependent, subunit alpha [Eubacteriales bacterium]|nr:L-serine ammonia-lyase, iron-sulfur-dependent, subunit alpha [Eubacteriales bacterium]
MNFKNIQELVQMCETQGKRFSDIMLESEENNTGLSKEEIFEKMRKNYKVMEASLEKGLENTKTHSGLAGGDSKKLKTYIENKNTLGGERLLRAVNYALAVNECNAAMGIICAVPTAGSCGVVPGVLLAMQENLKKSEDEMVQALLCAGAVGYVIANNAVISGAAGGCQAEVGTASAMAAAACVELAGGTPDMCANALAIALKNMLGLTCDPLAGLVEVPCIKRNAAGAANAITAADMALAGIKSYVPADEVIDAMYRIGISMPIALRETALGGLADTETGKKWKRLLWTNYDDNSSEE